MNKTRVYPYIPNSVPLVQSEMLKEIGAESIEELYGDIPESLRFKERLHIPDGLDSEYELKQHVNRILSKNSTCDANISFLGAGCYNHYVPAICDEINQRSEFLTAYAGEPFEDHGRFQAMFEYESMMGELLDMDVVNVPTYDWGQAASTSLRMAGRITGRSKVLVSEIISPERMEIIRNYSRGVLEIETVSFDSNTGLLDLKELKKKLSGEVSGFYFENPSYIGCIEHRCDDISGMIHDAGALSLVGTDPVSLGILTPPSQYGADIVTGDIQGLGMHMQYGGGQAGFIATRDEEKFVMQYPSRLFGIEKTEKEGEWGFGDVAFDRTSFADRDNCNEFIGTATALWGITAGVYLALMGPQGMKENGTRIMKKTSYTAELLSKLPDVNIRFPDTPVFKEFTVDFSNASLSVKEINTELLKKGIFGGKDISGDIKKCEECALYCVTEKTTLEDINSLFGALKEIL